MANLLEVGGATIGLSFGGPAGASAGASVGSALGSALGGTRDGGIERIIKSGRRRDMRRQRLLSQQQEDLIAAQVYADEEMRTRMAERAARGGLGRASTILTGPGGLTDTGTSASRMLL